MRTYIYVDGFNLFYRALKGTPAKWLDAYDCAIVVSNDSDLAEAMRLVKEHHPTKRLGLVTPGRSHPSAELLAHADFSRHIRRGALRRSQLPDPIPGTNIRKPRDW